MQISAYGKSQVWNFPAIPLLHICNKRLNRDFKLQKFENFFLFRRSSAKYIWKGNKQH